MSQAHVADKRSARTRRQLLDAFTELTQERGWDEIRVGDVCARARIARSTFYAHHAGKEALLISAIESMRRDLTDRRAAYAAAGQPFGYAVALLHHVKEHARGYRLLVARRTDYVVQQRFRKLVIDLMDQELRAILPDPGLLEPTARFLGGGLFELMIGWVKTGCTRNVDDMVALFHLLAVPVVSRSAPNRHYAKARAAKVRLYSRGDDFHEF